MKLILFMIFSTLCFGKSLNDIKNIDMVITQKSNKIVKYDLKFVKPNLAKKVVISPELNAGEIYIYNGNKKSVYLPMFEQKNITNISKDENDIVTMINYILEIENNKKLKKIYYEKRLRTIKFKNGTLIELNDFKQIDGYLLPNQFIIYNDNEKVAELDIENYKINTKIRQKEFEL